MLREMIRALHAGEELRNVATWKNTQAITGALTAILGFVALVLPYVGVKIETTPEQLSAIAGGIAAVVGLFNGYTTVATSAKVGLPSGDGDSNDPGREMVQPGTQWPHD